jgi:LemA protein
VQLKRRYDLVPNLVECVKKFMAHEKETLTAVIQARSACMNAQGVKEQAQAENMLTGALKSLFAVSEAYPELKSDQNMMQLQEELTTTENRIAFSRQHYNDSVMQYNTAIETAPTVFVAGMLNFEAAEFFEVDEPSERKAPKVEF